MWKILNSPLIIALVIISALFLYQSTQRHMAADSARAFYDEILSIAEDAGSDIERTRIIQTVVSEASKQAVAGIGSAFGAGSEEQRAGRASQLRQFYETKDKISVTTPRETVNPQSGQRTLIYQISNTSSEYLERVPADIEFYLGETLVDVNTQFGQSRMAPAETRSFRVVIPQGLEFDSVKVLVTDIVIADIEPGP